MPDVASARELARAHARHRRARRPPDRVRADGDGLRRSARPSATRSRSPRPARCWPGRGPPTSASSCSDRQRAWRCSPTSASSSKPGGGWREEAIASGAALRALERLLEAQGGDPRLAERPWDVLEAAPVVLAVPAPRSGSIERCGALAIGRAAMRLGAGRERKEDPIDHAVGVARAREARRRGGRGPAAGARACARRRSAPRWPRPRCSPPTSSSTARSSARRCCSRRSADRMPELPEVETVRRRLAPHLSGPDAGRGGGARPPADRPGASRGGRRAAARRARRAARPARQVPPDRAGTTARRSRCTCA